MIVMYCIILSIKENRIKRYLGQKFLESNSLVFWQIHQSGRCVLPASGLKMIPQSGSNRFAYHQHPGRRIGQAWLSSDNKSLSKLPKSKTAPVCWQSQAGLCYAIYIDRLFYPHGIALP